MSPPEDQITGSATGLAGNSGPARILAVGDHHMYAVYVLEDKWRLRATFPIRDAANIRVARLVNRGVRAKVFRSVENQRRAA
jgi:hypothetical protein